MLGLRIQVSGRIYDIGNLKALSNKENKTEQVRAAKFT